MDIVRCQWITLGNFSESFTEEDGGHSLWEEGGFARYKFFLPCPKSLCSCCIFLAVVILFSVPGTRLKASFCLYGSVCF
jgi:hypothetical protein